MMMKWPFLWGKDENWLWTACILCCIVGKWQPYLKPIGPHFTPPNLSFTTNYLTFPPIQPFSLLSSINHYPADRKSALYPVEHPATATITNLTSARRLHEPWPKACGNAADTARLTSVPWPLRLLTRSHRSKNRPFPPEESLRLEGKPALTRSAVIDWAGTVSFN